MKTLAILLASVLAAGSLTGCVAEPDAAVGSGLPPIHKPSSESPGAPGPTRESGIDDGRVTSVEIFETDDSTITKVHHLDSETGIDTIDVLDENDVVVRVETRYRATELEVAGRR